MDRDYIVFQEYKMYTEQKENFIDRNFRTNKFYMIAIICMIFAMIYTNNIVFLNVSKPLHPGNYWNAV